MRLPFRFHAYADDLQQSFCGADIARARAGQRGRGRRCAWRAMRVRHTAPPPASTVRAFFEPPHGGRAELFSMLARAAFRRSAARLCAPPRVGVRGRVRVRRVVSRPSSNQRVERSVGAASGASASVTLRDGPGSVQTRHVGYTPGAARHCAMQAPRASHPVGLLRTRPRRGAIHAAG